MVLGGMSAWCQFLVVALFALSSFAVEATSFPQCTFPNLTDASRAPYIFTVDLFPNTRSKLADPALSDDMYRALYSGLSDSQQIRLTIHKNVKGKTPKTLLGIYREIEPLCSLDTVTKYIVFTNDLAEPINVSASNAIPASPQSLLGQCALQSNNGTDTPEAVIRCVERYQ